MHHSGLFCKVYIATVDIYNIGHSLDLLDRENFSEIFVV